jgi:hypothetical protein
LYIYATICLILVIFYSIQITRIYHKLKVVRLGYLGEFYTGQELNYLMRDGAYVYHDIPYKYGNIDHIIVSTGGVFVVETKAVRKPSTDEGARNAKVSIKNNALAFPHATTREPLNQAARHAQWLAKELYVGVPVLPVVALPGWFIEGNNRVDNILVINPSRGKFLKSLVKENRISESNLEIVVKQIEAMARDVDNNNHVTNLDADRHYNAMLTKKNNN